MNEPLVSVMMIAYNNVQFLKAAIDSVINQTYQNWELIINDDKSTDGTYELAQKLAEQDSRIKVYQNEKNLKTPGNRAAAMKHINGVYICHLDADDMLYENAIEYQVKYLENNLDITLVYSDTAGINSKNEITTYNLHKNYEENLAWFGWKPFGMYRMSAYKKIDGFNTKLTAGCEDGDLFMQIAERYKFERNPFVLYYHRTHDNNTSPKNHSCGSCPDRPVCNYIRVWSKHANMDHITFTKLETA
jgi:glycosyltransferase involved in cell wall biosynthesis